MPRRGLDQFTWTDPELDAAVHRLRVRHGAICFARADIERVALAMTGRATRTLRDRLLATGRIAHCNAGSGRNSKFKICAVALVTILAAAGVRQLADGDIDTYAQFDLQRGDIGNPQDG